MRRGPRKLVLLEQGEESRAHRRQKRMLPEKGQWQYWDQAGDPWDLQTTVMVTRFK